MEITAGFGLQNDWSQAEYNRRRQTAVSTYKGRAAEQAEAAASAAAPTTRTRIAWQNAILQNQQEEYTDDSLGIEKKLQKGYEFQQELEDARINDPEKYEAMIRQIHLNSANSVGKFMDCIEENNGEFTFRGIHFGDGTDQVKVNVQREKKEINIGDMSSGRILSVPLSNGYTLNFNRENTDDISRMLDIFTPEDINAILNAIQEDNLVRNAEQEIEDEKSEVVKLAQNTGQEETAKADNQSSEKTNRYPDLSGLFADRDRKEEEAEGVADGSKAEKKTEESKTTSRILLRADGTKELVITTSIGDMEFNTSFKISEDEAGKKGYGESGRELAEEDPINFGKSMETPTLFRWNHALNSYEENFAYA